MANNSIKSIPAKAWLVAGGREYEITDMSVTVTATSIPVANVALAIGYILGTAGIILSDISALLDGADAEIYVDCTGATPLPGLPVGPTRVFSGNVTGVSPSIGGSGSANIGVQIVHTGMSKLMSGSTTQWGPMMAGNVIDPTAYINNAINRSRLSGGGFATDGIMPVLKDIFKQFMESSTTNAGAEFIACAGAADLNKDALEALSGVGGSQLKLQSYLASSSSMQAFLMSRLADIKALSVFDQLRSLGNDLMFELLPQATGEIIAVPMSTFSSTAHVVVSADDIFEFDPQFNPSRSIAGVVLIADPQPGGQSVAGGVAGCYTFPRSIVKAGILVSAQVPTWLGLSLANLSRTVDLASPKNPAANPTTATTTEPKPADLAPEDVAKRDASAETYGKNYARELARKARYATCRASFSTHLRVDIGPMSTIRVDAPIGITEDVSIYGRVDALTLRIADGLATTTFSLTYVRSGAIQEQIINEGGGDHPIYDDAPWVGAPL